MIFTLAYRFPTVPAALQDVFRLFIVLFVLIAITCALAAFGAVLLPVLAKLAVGSLFITVFALATRPRSRQGKG